MAGGRPSDYTQELADKICFQLASGLSIRTICKADDMPSGVTVYSWLRKFPQFLKLYEIARSDQADAIAEEAFEIADDSTNDYMDREGKIQLNAENVQRSRLRVDTRKWFASKIAPRKYGDKQTVAVEGGDPDKPVKIGYTLNFDDNTQLSTTSTLSETE